MRWTASARAFWLTVLFGSLLMAVLIPSARLYLVPLVAVLSTAVAIRGLIAWKPPAARAWWTVVAGGFLLSIGYVVSAADAVRWPDLRRVYPQPYDAFFMVGSVIAIIGVVLLLSRVHPSRDRGDLIDALMIAVGMGSLVLQRMLGSELAGGQPLAVAPVIAAMFPLASIILLTALMRVLLTGGVRNTTMVLLTATVLAAVLSDIPRARQAVEGGLTYDSLLAVLSVVKLAVFAAAATSPTVADPRVYAPARPTLASRPRQLVVTFLAYLGPVVLTIGWLAGRPVNPGLPMAATAAIVALSAWRVDTILRRMEHRASHDPLTGVLDRSTFHQNALSAAAGERRRCIGILDLDDFKALNDTYGHLVGDQVLVIVAERLSAGLRRDDVIARLGGDEYAVMFQADSPEAVAQRLVDRLHAPMSIGDRQLEVRVSLGLCLLAIDPTHPESAVEDALRRADDAMYSVKGTPASYAVDRG